MLLVTNVKYFVQLWKYKASPKTKINKNKQTFLKIINNVSTKNISINYVLIISEDKVVIRLRYMANIYTNIISTYIQTNYLYKCKLVQLWYLYKKLVHTFVKPPTIKINKKTTPKRLYNSILTLI